MYCEYSSYTKARKHKNEENCVRNVIQLTCYDCVESEVENRTRLVRGWKKHCENAS